MKDKEILRNGRRQARSRETVRVRWRAVFCHSGEAGGRAAGQLGEKCRAGGRALAAVDVLRSWSLPARGETGRSVREYSP